MKKIIILLIVFVSGFSLGYAANTLVLLQRAFLTSPSESVSVSSNTAQETASESTEGGGVQSATPKEPITIPANALTDGQKALLGKLGIDPTTFVVTPEMVSCAEDALGPVRVSEIVGGGTPSPLEVVRLSPCLNK